MAISYVEDIASEYYRIKGYLISRDVHYQVPKEISKKRVSGWKDIDILALNEKEALIIECKGFTGTTKASEMYKKLLDGFRSAEEYYVKNMPLFKDKKIRKVLVVDYSTKKLDDMLSKANIEIYRLENLMKDFLKILKPRLDKCRMGKEEHPMTRTLLFLVKKGFLKERLEEI